MRSSSGPCGLSAQRLRASSASSARTAARNRSRASALKAGTAIAVLEADERCAVRRDDRQHLEKLALLRGREQLLRLGGDPRAVQRVLGIRLCQHARDAAVDEELRLRREAEHLGAARPSGVRERAEVDMRGDVLVARPGERIGVRAVLVVAYEGAARALRVVVLARRKAIVNDEDRAALERLRERAHPGAGQQADLAHVWYRHRDALGRSEQLARG